MVKSQAVNLETNDESDFYKGDLFGEKKMIMLVFLLNVNNENGLEFSRKR